MMNNRNGLHPIKFTSHWRRQTVNQTNELMSGSTVHRRPVHLVSSQRRTFWTCPPQQIRLMKDGPQHCCAELPVRKAGHSRCDLGKEVWQPQSIRSALSSEACCLLLYLFQVHFVESDQSFLIVYVLLKGLSVRRLSVLLIDTTILVSSKRKQLI